VNKVIIIGRQTKDADVRYTNEGLAIARFSIAVDRRGKDKGADFPNVVAFGKIAELVEKYGTKGKKWALEGHLQTGSYEKDGHKVYTTDVIADSLEFVESKSAEGDKEVELPLDTFVNIPEGIEAEIPFN